VCELGFGALYVAVENKQEGVMSSKKKPKKAKKSVKAVAKKAIDAKSQPATPAADSKNTSAQMKARAKELDQSIRSRRDQVRRGPLEDGWDAAEMKRGNLWVYLGFDDETEYRKSLNIGRSTWFRYRRLAEGLCKLPKAEFLKLIAENADHLVKLPEDRRYDKDLIKKAQTLTEEEFEKVVIKFKAKADKVDEGEVTVSFKLRMPESRREFILETLAEFKKEHKLDANDDSRALELVCAEVRDGEHVRTKVIQALPKLRATLDLLNGKGTDLAADEIISKAHGQIGEYIRDTAAAAGINVAAMAAGVH